jgi:hypothetical protein
MGGWVVCKNLCLPVLSSKALKVLIPFPTTYLCEKAFSALVYVKNKFRNRLENVESELRLKLSNIEPNIEKLCQKCNIILHIKYTYNNFKS